ncbi:GMC family oxidoreductase [Stenotrophobium rhamnosiphilum]|uniref:Glucose-methanol-choline oxidoreductase N-terminal domain-containing protein n=1 Tax=Stenotrophobium rhamnosiphilum TaxID=2029166 RepID=A0A2T5MKL5_9GAMM|nr:GMC family oxidoreductase N-terminal domain-containing protein [Stenotrophobium rhamnosiphilum]PTU33104.1 hypothetical protein CJD38_03085 [Stenotrophobium rhamnosiphilum]
MTQSNELVSDYVIVGGGSAGAALAYRLSENPAVSVTLLEAGGSYRKFFFTVPLGGALAYDNPRYNWGEWAEPDATRGGQRDYWPRGKVLGGSSSINGQIFVRGNREDYDRWRLAGNPGWGWDDVLPYFKKLETSLAFGGEYHGKDGPVHVSPVCSPHPLAETFVQAAIQAGVPANPDLNGARQEGVAQNQVSQFNGRRDSTAWAYLDRARQRPNLNIVTGAMATRVLFEGLRAVGVEFRRGSALSTARARREVILSASAVGSAKLLMLSGIGPEAHLKDLGIPVLLNRPGVGSNLQDHCGPWMTWEMRQPTMNNQYNPFSLAKALLRWWRSKDGLMTMPGCESIAFVKSQPDLKEADAQIHFTPVGLEHQGSKHQIYKFASVSLIPNLGNPIGRGDVRLRSADPADAPLIRPALMDERDLPAFVGLIHLCRKIMESTPMREQVVREVSPGPAVSTEAEIVAYLKAKSLPHYHPVGTCKMGDDPAAVVDARCRVHGVNGLRVVDASIAPTLVNANTNAMAIMIGERAADLIKADAAL